MILVFFFRGVGFRRLGFVEVETRLRKFFVFIEAKFGKDFEIAESGGSFRVSIVSLGRVGEVRLLFLI